MIKVVACVLLLFLVGANAQNINSTEDIDCETIRQNLIDGTFDPAGNLSCIDPCDDSGTVIVGEANCSTALFCVWDEISKTCVLKTENINSTENKSCETTRQNLIDGTFDPAGNLSCIDPCDESGKVIVEQANCSTALFCGWNETSKTCKLKTENTNSTENIICETTRQNLIDGTFDPAGNLSCIDPCDESGTVIVEQVNCSNALFCGWDEISKTCKLNTEKEPQQQINETDVSFLTAQLPTGTPPPTTTTTTTTTTTAETATGVEGKLFAIGGPGPIPPFVPQPSFVQPQYNVFPYNCQINPHDPNLYKLLDPPVNIPYCQRIPCSKSDPSLEVNRYGCLSRPGCAYDTQLANIRQTKGHAILPGVPVCHLAIRNEQFHKLVGDYLKTGGAQWNGLHTRCFLAQHGAAILKAPCGCEVIASLQYFGIQPKIAGWPGITKDECHLINGCYKNGHCFFPVTSGKIQIKSAKDTHRSFQPTGKDIYGQPQCLPFDIDAKPTDYLSNYHNCYLSGCAMDPSIGFEQIKKHLCQIALNDTVPNHLKRKFWAHVLSGKIRADNWREELSKLRYDTCPPVFSPVPPSNLNPTSNFFTNYLPGCTPIPGINANFPGINPSFPQPTPFSFAVPPPQANSFVYPNPNPVRFPNPKPFPFPFPFPTVPICPYKQFSIHGYQPLTGSFEGCCERHHCYIPRSALDSQYSGVASYYADWTTWSECSASCQGGFRTRSRVCVGKGQCEGDHEQQQRCNDVACPYFETWGSWGDCSATCGGGRKSRSRVCSPSGSGCSGPSEEDIDCNTGACPTLSQWSAYSDCSVTCGHGWKTRTRSCIYDGAYGCCTIPTDSLEETKSCQVYCGSPVEVSRTTCTSSFMGCYRTVTYVCQYQGQPGHCLNFQSTKQVACSFHECFSFPW